MPMFARHSTPHYPSYIFSISFVFLNSPLFCVISTVQWSGATSICDGIISFRLIKSSNIQECFEAKIIFKNNHILVKDAFDSVAKKGNRSNLFPPWSWWVTFMPQLFEEN